MATPVSAVVGAGHDRLDRRRVLVAEAVLNASLRDRTFPPFPPIERRHSVARWEKPSRPLATCAPGRGCRQSAAAVSPRWCVAALGVAHPGFSVRTTSPSPAGDLPRVVALEGSLEVLALADHVKEKAGSAVPVVHPEVVGSKGAEANPVRGVNEGLLRFLLLSRAQVEAAKEEKSFRVVRWD